MQTTSPTQDWPLLRRYVEQHSQEAFAALVSRHLNLVYATCRREVGDAALAEDVTQVVFLLLARKAPSLRSGTHLAGWLFQTARFASRNALTREQRRRHYEHKAAQTMAEQNDHDDALWDSLEPFLNDAMARLSVGDREAILLRFWDEQSLAETGAALGVTEDTARKRVVRAVGRLRLMLAKDGVTISDAALGALLPAHAVQAAPAMLTPTIAQMAAGVTAGHIINAGLVGPHIYQLSEGALRAMKIAQLKMTAFITTAAVLGLTTFGIATGVFLTVNNSRVVDASAPSQPRWVRLMTGVPGKTPSAREVVEHCQQAYGALRTYQVSVTVTSRSLVGPSQQSVINHTSANIEFVRPGKIHAAAKSSTPMGPMGLMPFVGTYAYVSNGSATYLRDWDTGNIWRKAHSTDDAIASYQGVANAAISALPAVLLGTLTYNPFSRGLTYSPVVQQGTLDGAACYLVTGTASAPTRTETESFYIDKKTFRLRQFITDSSGTVNAGAGNVRVKSHSDQVYTNEIVDAPIPDSMFLTPPAK